MIFTYTDYKDILRSRTHENLGRTGYKSALARAAGAPASFISQVLHTHVHLTQDHALKLARFWDLTDDERDYFLDLVSLARAGTPELRHYLETRLEAIRKRNSELSHRIKPPLLSNTEQEWLYFSTWYYGAIHLLLTIPKFRTVNTLAQRLRLPPTVVESALEKLRDMEFVSKSGASWLPTRKSIHLSSKSPASSVNHFIWRQKAAEDTYANREESLHYTALQTLSRDDLKRVRELLLQSIERSRAIVEPSPEEVLVCLDLDLFEV